MTKALVLCTLAAAGLLAPLPDGATRTFETSGPSEPPGTPGTPGTLDDILASHIEARGGYERIKAVQTLRMTRTYGTFAANIPVVITRKRPYSMRVDQTLPNGRTAARGVDRQSAWDLAPDGTISERSPEWSAETREIDGDFDGPLVDYREKGHSLAYAGRERIGGIDAHKLTLTLRSGSTRTVYLDAVSFLERRGAGQVTLPPGPQGTKTEVVLTYGDYRDVGGLKFPFAVDEERNAFPVMTIAIYTEKIELDVPVDDSAFAKPAGSAQKSPAPQAAQRSVFPGRECFCVWSSETLLHAHAPRIACNVPSNPVIRCVDSAASRTRVARLRRGFGAAGRTAGRPARRAGATPDNGLGAEDGGLPGGTRSRCLDSSEFW